MITDIMLDLETLGTGPNAAIISIGAVAFNATQSMADQSQLLPGGRTTPSTFYKNVDLTQSEYPGDIDATTVMWWLEQGLEAKEALTRKPRVTLGVALDALNVWIRDQGTDLNLWSNGPTFDEVIIRSAYRRNIRDTCLEDLPIDFWRSRCCRSLKEQAEQMGWVPSPHAKDDLVAHNALHDAIGQARALVSQKTFMRNRSTLSI